MVLVWALVLVKGNNPELNCIKKIIIIIIILKKYYYYCK